MGRPKSDDTIPIRLAILFEKHPDQVLPHNALWDEWWPKTPGGDMTALYMAISYTRKLVSGTISSVRDRGYIFTPGEQSAET